MSTPDRYKRLDPNAEFAVCPLVQRLAVRWGFGNFPDELYWKRAHFKW